MGFGAPELVQLLHGQFRGRVGGGGNGQGDKDLVHMEPGIMIAQVFHLQVLDGLDDDGGDQMHPILDIAQGFEHVEEQGAGSAQ